MAQRSRADALISSGYFYSLRTNRCVRFGFWRVNRARGLMCRSSVVLHDSCYVVVLLKDKPQSCRVAKVSYHLFLL